MPVDHGSPIPAYQQVHDDLLRRIEAGEWARGPLPSVRTLHEEYDVAQETAIRALRMLRDEGVVFTVARRGTYVSQGHGGA
jgi:GntR family transcriptional regulator